MGIIQIKEKFFETLKRSPKLTVYLCMAAVCIAALLFMRAPPEKEETSPKTYETVETAVQESYEQRLESELEGIISKIQGVTNVTVMLTIDGTEEKVYVSDISESDSKSESKTVITGSKEALLQSTKYPNVMGVLVVCGGGNSAAVKEKVVNAVSTVLDIPASKVYVTNAK